MNTQKQEPPPDCPFDFAQDAAKERLCGIAFALLLV